MRYYAAMDFFHATRNKRLNKLKDLNLGVFGFRIETGDLVIIKVPNSRALKLMMTLALSLSFVVVLSFHRINILTVDPPHVARKAVKTRFPDHQLGQIKPSTNTNLLLQSLLRVSSNEGILKMSGEGDRASPVNGGGGNNNDNAAVIRNREAAVGRRLLGLLPNIDQATKAAALRKLEDVLLEPPRAASGKSSTYFKHTRYLPDLIGDSLETYRRRVFINVALSGNTDATTKDPNWFSDHYPTRNKKFEIYNIETVPVNKRKTTSNPPQVVGISDWVKRNVQENEYVVMKAEAEVVEEMIKSRAIKLVDELFLECQHRGIKKGGRRSSRAYWECLALYGILRDEGVAVHQWWG